MTQNKTFGAALLVAGTTIGAGMLAMPLTSAKLGFGMTMVLLLVLWALLCYSALLFVELYQNAKHTDAGIASLAEQHFGMIGRVLASASLILFMYAILAAYVAGGGDLLSSAIATSPKVAAIIFTLVLGAFVIISTQAVDMLTRVLFLLKLVCFAGVLLFMLPKVSPINLSAAPMHSLLILSASPVFFTSFGFHVIIPSINHYLDGDIKKMRTAIILGTAIALIAYILWQMATHGVFSQAQLAAIVAKNPSLTGLVEAAGRITGSHLIAKLMQTFSTLALITSFLGVALALLDCLDDLYKRTKSTNNALISKQILRLILGALTLMPPILLVWFYPDGFLMLLGYAGLMFAFYGLVLPVFMVWRLRKHTRLAYRVIGGNATLILALILGILVMSVPYLVEQNLLPAVVG